MKKSFLIYVSLILISAFASCEKAEWKQSTLTDVPVETIVGTFPEKTDSIDIYKEQNFVILHQGDRLEKNQFTTYKDSVDADGYYGMKLVYNVADGYTYTNEAGETVKTDKIVTYDLEGFVEEDKTISDITADIISQYFDANGELVDIDSDFVSNVAIHNGTKKFDAK